MSKTFKIIRDYYDKKHYLFDKTKVTINPGLTVLVGCNGCGKSTFIHQITDILKNEKAPLLYFNNLFDGGAHARSLALYENNLSFVAASMCSSEGQNIVLNLYRICTNIQEMARECVSNDVKEAWVVLDAIDSGLSIDNIDDFKHVINLLIDNYKEKGINLYVVVSANTYEFARNIKCLDVVGGRYIKFDDYEDYRKFILISGELKEERDRIENE